VKLGQSRPAGSGKAFNGLLTDLFAIFSLEPSQPFRVVGEEIDGALYFHNETYLIEAKWTAAKASAQALYARYVVELRTKWFRGQGLSSLPS